MTTKTTHLTPLDQVGADRFAVLIAHYYTEGTPVHAHQDAIFDVVQAAVRDPELALVARFLGAVELERNVWGDRRFGQDDPPTAGFLGRAIDEVIEQLTPLVEARAPRFMDFVREEYAG